MIETVARMIGVEVEPRAELFADLRRMEDAGLGALAEMARAAAARR